jgi:hypothetical protein
MLKIVRLSILLAVMASCPVMAAIDDIPESSGFSGFFLTGPGVFSVASNLIVEGAPLLDDVGNTQIESIFASPSSQSAPAWLLAGELNYTFASTRTQIFIGNRFEDILRLDLTYGIGVRQELPDDSILAFSFVATPLDMSVWSDPYVEGVDRVATDRNMPGVRLRWGRMFKTGLEFTATYRDHRHDAERSGDFLVGQGRLDATLQPLLSRQGDSLVLRFLYRFEVKKRHIFEPTIRYTKLKLDGAAMRSDAYAVRLTYIYRTPKLAIDANLVMGTHKADAVHPVYGTVKEADRLGGSVVMFFDLFNKKRLRAFAMAEYLTETANIDFFDSKIGSLSIGVFWRHGRK